MSKQCEHFSQEKKGTTPNTKSCEECEKEHLPVVAIRMCLTCGHVGCCDSSIGKHATKHFKETGHSVMKAIPGDIWNQLHPLWSLLRNISQKYYLIILDYMPRQLLSKSKQEYR